MTGEWLSCLICTDCAMWQANGECLVVGGEAEALAVSEVEGRWVVGDHHGFSFHRCDACHRPYAGDRYGAERWVEYADVVETFYDEVDNTDPALLAEINGRASTVRGGEHETCSVFVVYGVCMGDPMMQAFPTLAEADAWKNDCQWLDQVLSVAEIGGVSYDQFMFIHM